MADAEGVVVTFAALGEARDAAVAAQPGHAFAPAGEDLVCVGLVADVPHQTVARGVIDVVQGQRQLDSPEVGREVAAGLGDRFDEEGAQLFGELGQLLAFQRAQRGRRTDGVEQGVAGHGV